MSSPQRKLPVWISPHASHYWTPLLPAAAAVLVGAGLVNAVSKGGDFAVFLEAGRRLLHREPLYAGSRVAEGMIGPPFQALFFAPFAMLAPVSATLVRIVWYALNLVLLVSGILWWTSALDGPTSDEASAPWWNRLQRPPLLLALLAISSPLHTNFQHQNLNVVLLAAVGGAALALGQRRDSVAGALIGFAAALKVFPALLLPWLALKRRWRALEWGVATIVILTALPIVAYGPAAFVGMLGEWWRLSGSGGWPVRSQNQSLFAMLARWSGPGGLTATGALAFEESALTYWLWFAAAVALMTWSGACLWSSKRHDADIAESAAVAIGVAVLTSPIAWDHYWVLFYPALYVCLVSTAGPMRPALVLGFWSAAALTTGPALLSRYAWRVSRWLSAKTLAGLLLVIVLSLAIRRWQQRAGPVSTSPPPVPVPPPTARR